ncbi:MAG: hypothetical protein PHN92_07910 [Geobacter sp.]|nr:hypothetical protein [Geobacter sp.]
MPLPRIGNREIIPVRYISYVTGWDVSPDVVAKILAHSETFQRFGELYAYHIQTGSPAKMLPKEWNVILADLDILAEALKEGETFEQKHYPQWRVQSIEKLPPSAFVWKDKFEQAYTYARDPERWSYIEEIDGIRALNLHPLLPAGMREVVFEGFESLLDTSDSDDLTIESAPYLSKEHPYFSAELEAAVAVWMALYNSGGFIKKQAPKKQIEEWLRLHRKPQAFTKAAIARIVTLVNPLKKGGSPPIE